MGDTHLHLVFRRVRLGPTGIDRRFPLEGVLVERSAVLIVEADQLKLAGKLVLSTAGCAHAGILADVSPQSDDDVDGPLGTGRCTQTSALAATAASKTILEVIVSPPVPACPGLRSTSMREGIYSSVRRSVNGPMC